MVDQLVVGFDLDMTLIDTAPGFRDVLEALGGELGVEFPVEEMTAKLGPPLDLLLEPYLAAEAIPAAGDRFRALYPDHAITGTPAFDGAHEAIAAVRRHAGRVVVVTGGCTREELLAAGTHVVLDSLADFPAWLDGHLLDLRLAALEADLS